MEAESQTQQSKLRDNLTVWFRCHVCPRAYTNVKKFVEHTSICNYCQMNGGNSEGDASTPETIDKRSSMKDISVPGTSTNNSVRSPVPTATADPDVGPSPASSYNSDPDPRMTRTMTRPRRQIIKQVTTNCDFKWSESADQDKCGKMRSRDWKSHDNENDCMHSNNTTSASDSSNDDCGYNISNKICRLNSSSRSSVKKLRVPNQKRYTVKRKQEIIGFPNSESNPMLPVPERVAEDRGRNYMYKGSRKTSFLSDQTRCTDSIKSSTAMLMLEKDLSHSNTEDMDFWANWPTNTEGSDGDCDDTDSRKHAEVLKNNSSSNIPVSAVVNKCTSKNTKNSENLDLNDINSSSSSCSSTSSSEYQAESSNDNDSDSDYIPFPITKIVCVKSLERKFDNAVAATKRRLVMQKLNPKKGHLPVPEQQPMSAPILLPEPLQVPIPILKYPEREIKIDEEALANQALYRTNDCSSAGDKEALVLYLSHETGFIESTESANTPLFFTIDPPSNKENDDFWLNWTSDDDESKSSFPETVDILKGGSVHLTQLGSHPGLENPTHAATTNKRVQVSQAKRKINPKSKQGSTDKRPKNGKDQQIVKNSSKYQAESSSDNDSDSDYIPFPIKKIVAVKSLKRKLDNAVASTKQRLVKQKLNPKQGRVRVRETQPMSAPLLLPEPLQVPIPLLKYPERKIMIDEEALANQALYRTNYCIEGDQEALVLYLNHETGFIESIESASTPLFFTSDPPPNKESDDFWLNWTSDDDESNNSNFAKTVDVGISKGGSIHHYLTPLASHPGQEEPTQAATTDKRVQVSQSKRKINLKSNQDSTDKRPKNGKDQHIVKHGIITTNNINRSDGVDGSNKKFIKRNVYTSDSSSDSPSNDNVEFIEISSGSNCSSSSSISSLTSSTTDSDSSSMDNTAEDRTGESNQNGGKKIKKLALQTQRHKRVCPISKLSQHLNDPSSQKWALAPQIVKRKRFEVILQDSPKTKNQEEDYQLQKPMNQRKNRNDSSQTLMSLPLSITARLRQNITQRMISTQTCGTKADPKE